MTIPTRLDSNERALNTTLAHALTLSITVILIIGLVTATTGFFESEREQVAQEELETIGNRIASDAMQATSLADRGGVTNITTEHPETVAGSAYSATVLSGSDCETGANTCIQLETADLDVSVVVPVYNETGFDITSTEEGAFTVTTTGSGSVTSTNAPSRVSDISVSSEVGVGAGINQISSVSLTQPGNQQPAANFEFSPAAPHAGTSIEFNASASDDPDGVIKEYRWDFDDDGAFEVATTSSTTNRSLTAGKHNVTLEVWDGTARGNTSTVIDVSGLSYLRDLDTISSDDSATFTVRNDFSRTIELQQLLVDPADDSISELDEETTDHEVEIDTGLGSGHWVEYDNGLALPAGGEFIDFRYDGDSRDDGGKYVALSPGETATVDLRYFDQPIQGEELTLGLKYQYGSDDTVTNTTVFTDVVGGPDISNYQVTASGPDGQNVDVSFDSNQQLTDINAQISGDASGTLDESDFSETNPGPGTYTYTADVSDGSNGTFTVELTTAESGGAASGETPLSDTAYVGTTVGILWETAGDWDDITLIDGTVVHATFGDHSADSVELGYTRAGAGLVGYWPLDDTSAAPDESTDDATSDDGSINGDPDESNGIGGSTGYTLDPTDTEDDYVRIPTSSEMDMGNEDEVTVSMWVNKQDTNTDGALFQHSDESYRLNIVGGNEPRFTIHADGDDTSATYENGIGKDEWVHVTGTFNNGLLRLYVNGQLEEISCQGIITYFGCLGSDGIADASEPLGIGENIDTRNDGTPNPFDGKIDEVRVYDRTLSEDEVEDLYETFEESTFTTDTKTVGTTIDADDLGIQYDIETNAQTTVEARIVTGSGDTSDWETLSDGSSQVDVSGISTDTDTFQVEVRLSTSSVTESPVINSIGVIEQ